MKSHVGMEFKVCPVCTSKFSTGAILLDRRLTDTLERETITGWELCQECETSNKDGYIALVAIKDGSGNRMNPDEVYREGIVIHIKRDVALRLIPELETHIDKPLVWVPKSLCEQLQGMVQR